MIREPAVAGTFYPDDPGQCQSALDDCLAASVGSSAVRGRIIGGLVPHAGWSCSGSVAAAVFSAIAAQRQPATVVILGAVHRPRDDKGAVFSSGRWDFPTGPVTIDDRLAERVLGHTNLIVADPYAHEPEHSIEVQVPFVRRLFPDAKLLPIMVPPSPRATEIGRSLARTLESYRCDAVVVASSDLTHYGPRYGFTPQGRGDAGLDWAKDVNDRRMIDLVLALDAESVVPEAAGHQNACGSGAIAAAIAACQALGAQTAELLTHTTSRETIGSDLGGSAVGYAGIVFTT